MKVVKALMRNDDGITHAALDMLSAIMQPMHDNPDLKQEQLNKASLLASSKFQEKLLETWVYHVVSEHEHFMISNFVVCMGSVVYNLPLLIWTRICGGAMMF